MAKKILGIIFILGGLYFLFRPIAFSDYRTQTIGTVLAVNTQTTYSITEHKDLRKTDVTVSYQTADGKTIQFDTTSVSPFASYKVGQTVSVMYDPQNPSQAGLKDEYIKWYIPLLLWVFGLALLFSSQLSKFKAYANSNNQ